MLTDEEMVQYMKAVELLEHICQSSTDRYPLRHELLIELTNVMVEMNNAYRLFSNNPFCHFSVG